MGHRAEIESNMAVNYVDAAQLLGRHRGAMQADVLLLSVKRSQGLESTPYIIRISENLTPGAELVLYGDLPDLAAIQQRLPEDLRYHLCVAVRAAPFGSENALFVHGHRGLLFLGKQCSALQHVRVRIGYEYCPACGKTTKDYGGRKHLYHEYGTLMSDVWRDIQVTPDDLFPTEVVHRVRDMLSVEGREKMLVAEASSTAETTERRRNVWQSEMAQPGADSCDAEVATLGNGELWRGDALDVLSQLRSESVDLAFADPPYNLAKKYSNWNDALDVRRYFEWCDSWLAEYLRVLKTGGYLAVLNVPRWAFRHASFLDSRAHMCNWVVWDAMSMPVRRIMPSHYALLVYRKGGGEGSETAKTGSVTTSQQLGPDAQPLPLGYCRRPSCIRSRAPEDRTGLLTDLWTDIDRLKHNSLRWDHPCQLPPRLMRRLIACTTNPGDVVLDAFNGIGTTSLAAQQLNRRFLGIELSAQYHEIAIQRHCILDAGGDPFAKRDKTPVVKNNGVRRMGKEKYDVPKKKLQLAVKALSQRLGRLPSRQDVEENLPYPIAYFDRYFKSWSEVLAAARTTGMSERPITAREEERRLPL